MNINANTVVSITYELHTTTPEGQQVFVEKANEEQPLVFLYGLGMMLPKFEEHLTGLKAGDEYSFELSPAEGYGELDATAHVDLPIDMFKEAGELPKVGDVIPLQDNQGISVKRNRKCLGNNLSGHFCFYNKNSCHLARSQASNLAYY